MLSCSHNSPSPLQSLYGTVVLSLLFFLFHVIDADRVRLIGIYRLLQVQHPSRDLRYAESVYLLESPNTILIRWNDESMLDWTISLSRVPAT